MKIKLGMRIVAAFLVISVSAMNMGGLTGLARAMALTVTIHTAAAPWVNLASPLALTGVLLEAGPTLSQAGLAPVGLSLAADDLDNDGHPDLLAGFALEEGGQLRVHSNPTGFGVVRMFSLPVRPDFLVTGDFDADGISDVVIAERDGDALWFLPGDGNGSLGAPEAVTLPGRVTALAAGEVFRQDGLADLAVGVMGPEVAQMLLFMGQPTAL
jgi:hypothetical protein